MKVNMYPHKTDPGAYTLDYRPGGAKGKRVREHYGNREDALEAKAGLEGKPLQSETVTFPRLKEIVDEYLAWCEKNQATATYVGKKCRLLKHVIPALGDRRVKDLSQRMLDAYGVSMAKGSYRQDIIDLQAMVKWMVKRRYCVKMDWSPEVPAYKQGIKHLPDVEDIKKFISALRFEHHRTVCLLMLYTGLRWNEARSLRWEDYRGTEILARVTKTDNPEIITIPAACSAWFEAQKKPTGYIFSSDKGKTCICNLERPVRAAFRASGVYMTAHMFRHASATFLYEITGDIYAVQHHLRHSKVTTSQIYTRYSAARRRGSIDALAEMLDKVDSK